MSHHRYTEHHTPPRSRGGTETVQLPKPFHESWHVLFHNMTKEEIRLFLEDLFVLFQQKDKITAGQLHDLRQEIKKALGGA